MAGDSARQKQAGNVNRQLLDDRSYIKNVLGNANTNAGNVYDGYNYMYTPEQLLANLRDQATLAEEQINQSAENEIAQGNQDVAERMASRGVTGGLAESTLSGNRTAVNKNRMVSLSNIKNNLLNANQGVMQGFNAMDLQKAGLKQGVNERNIDRTINKYAVTAGALGNNSGLQLNNLQNYSGGTWLDDALALINSGANVYSAINGKGK